jgi:hypothetical protein
VLSDEIRETKGRSSHLCQSNLGGASMSKESPCQYRVEPSVTLLSFDCSSCIFLEILTLGLRGALVRH